MDGLGLISLLPGSSALVFFSDADVALQSLDYGVQDGRGVSSVGVGHSEGIGFSQRVGHLV